MEEVFSLSAWNNYNDIVKDIIFIYIAIKFVYGNINIFCFLLSRRFWIWFVDNFRYLRYIVSPALLLPGGLGCLGLVVHPHLTPQNRIQILTLTQADPTQSKFQLFKAKWVLIAISEGFIRWKMVKVGKFP